MVLQAPRKLNPLSFGGEGSGFMFSVFNLRVLKKITLVSDWSELAVLIIFLKAVQVFMCRVIQVKAR